MLVIGCGDNTNNSSGGAGGSGGTGGGGVVLGQDPAGAKNPSDVLKAAVIIGSCVPDDGIVRNLIRMYTQRGRTGELELSNFSKCVAAAGGGCAAIETCMGLTIDVAPMAGCTAACDGDKLTACGDGMKFSVDCSKFDLACSVTEADCVPKTLGTICDWGTYVESCKNGAPLLCGGLQTEISGPVCADYGLTCKVDMNAAVCVGSGAACQPASTTGREIDYSQGVGCNGTKLTTCMNGFLHDVDCGTLATGFTCQTVGTISFCGQAAECAQNDGVKSMCEGDNVVVCNAGKLEKVDCKSLGFTGCNAMHGTCSPSVYDKF